MLGHSAKASSPANLFQDIAHKQFLHTSQKGEERPHSQDLENEDLEVSNQATEESFLRLISYKDSSKIYIFKLPSWQEYLPHNF